MADYRRTTSGAGSSAGKTSQSTPMKSEQSKAGNQGDKEKKKKTPEELEKVRKRQARRDRRKKRKRVRRIILSYLLVIFLLVVVIGGYYVYERFGKYLFKYRDAAIELVADSSPDTFRQDETSIVYDCNG